jgi:hypothetical protein
MPAIVDTWPRRIESGEQVPDSFREKFNEILNNISDFPYTIFAPPDRWGRKRTTPKLLSLVQGQLFILEKHKKGISVTRFNLEGIAYLERGKSLLYSWLNVHSRSQQPGSSLVEFNTVTENLFLPIVNRIREMIGEGTEISSGDKHAQNTGFTTNPEGRSKAEQAKFDYLSHLNYKFMNFGKDSLLSEGKVIQIIYQPEVRIRRSLFFQKYITPAHIEILTDKELIIIKEDGRNKGRLTYGGIWNYIPLAQISILTVTHNEKDQCSELALKLLSGESIILKYDLTQSEDTLKRFRDAFRTEYGL